MRGTLKEVRNLYDEVVEDRIPRGRGVAQKRRFETLNFIEKRDHIQYGAILYFSEEIGRELSERIQEVEYWTGEKGQREIIFKIDAGHQIELFVRLRSSYSEDFPLGDRRNRLAGFRLERIEILRAGEAVCTSQEMLLEELLRNVSDNIQAVRAFLVGVIYTADMLR